MSYLSWPAEARMSQSFKCQGQNVVVTDHMTKQRLVDPVDLVVSENVAVVDIERLEQSFFFVNRLCIRTEK